MKSMSTPIFCLIAFVYVVVATCIVSFVLALISKAWGRRKPKEPTKEDMANAFFYSQRERWHKEQGHIKRSMTVIDMKMGRFGDRWEDKHGNDVTHKSRF